MNGIKNRRLLQAERRTFVVPRAGGLRVGMGYANTYRIGMSSLAYQWSVELAAGIGDIGVERFFADPELSPGRTIEAHSALGDLDVLAWSCSFELDTANLLATLDAAGIPRRSSERTSRHPLLVMGGAVASINPLPLAPAIDVFVLGSAELLWPPLLHLIQENPSRDRLLLELADRDGFFVPRHHLEVGGRPQKVRRVEKRDVHMADPAMVPVSHVVTPHTEYSNRGLVEMSRGCPEKCRYCWVSYNYGRLRCYPKDAILDRVDRLHRMTDRVGFVATAVGDHPDLAEILEECRRREINVALSSLRIPAMREEVLKPLAESGARSITIAPETGTDELRRKLNKPITNASILEAVDTALRCGIENLKMYFIIGLPGETDGDLKGIVDLLRQAQEILVSRGRDRGHVGTISAGFNVLVPKPYTPYAREAMLDRQEARRRMELVESGVRDISNLRTERPAYREAVWQAFLSRGDVTAFDVLATAASGCSLGQVLKTHRTAIEASALNHFEGEPAWQFVTSAPVRETSRRKPPVPGSNVQE
ncbi:MAG: B12-binding domain-containing radical SAM protein [Acidobacteria bacterium]|nr:B12-binding domain-containing radical SAM protein [Acidobacteriota bacterium]